ncbi:outer membrane protein [Taklimakanibacter lacteus]|uniref:outer membrane protein n=1 Tax=Taklimakanibacter lacteus TaxID=2268456 RepID=UPI000E669857
MKKSLLAATAILALNLFVVNARAADVAEAERTVFYVSLFAGASILDDVDTKVDFGTYDRGYSVDTRTGYLLGGAIGLRIWDPLRAEVEISHARWKAKSFEYENTLTYDASGHLSATYLLGNLWIDIPTDSAFTPYVGGGAGVAWADGDTRFEGEDIRYADGELGFAFQLGGGIALAVTDQLSLDVGYRFKGVLDIDFDNGIGAPQDFEGGDLYSHNVQAGVTFGF